MYHCHLKAETINTKGYKRGAGRQFVWRASFSNYAINVGLLFFKNNPADNILFLLAHERL